MKIPDYTKKKKQPTYLEMVNEIERLHSIIKEVRECIEHYAIENDDYTKLYSAEEQDILKLLDKES